MTPLPSTRHARLLLVDDDEEACRLLAEVLEREAYDVVPALSADEALAKVEEAGPFDAVHAVAAVSRTLDELSTDSLRRWRERYADALSGPANAAGTGAGSGRGESGGGR